MTSFNTHIPTYFSSWWYRESTCMCGRQCVELLSLSRDITIQPRFTTAIFWKTGQFLFNLSLFRKKFDSRHMGLSGLTYLLYIGTYIFLISEQKG